MERIESSSSWYCFFFFGRVSWTRRWKKVRSLPEQYITIILLFHLFILPPPPANISLKWWILFEIEWWFWILELGICIWRSLSLKRSPPKGVNHPGEWVSSKQKCCLVIIVLWLLLWLLRSYSGGEGGDQKKERTTGFVPVTLASFEVIVRVHPCERGEKQLYQAAAPEKKCIFATKNTKSSSSLPVAPPSDEGCLAHIRVTLSDGRRWVDGEEYEGVIDRTYSSVSALI